MALKLRRRYEIPLISFPNQPKVTVESLTIGELDSLSHVAYNTASLYKALYQFLHRHISADDRRRLDIQSFVDFLTKLIRSDAGMIALGIVAASFPKRAHQAEFELSCPHCQHTNRYKFNVTTDLINWSETKTHPADTDLPAGLFTTTIEYQVDSEQLIVWEAENSNLLNHLVMLKMITDIEDPDLLRTFAKLQALWIHYQQQYFGEDEVLADVIRTEFPFDERLAKLNSQSHDVQPERNFNLDIFAIAAVLFSTLRSLTLYELTQQPNQNKQIRYQIVGLGLDEKLYLLGLSSQASESRAQPNRPNTLGQTITEHTTTEKAKLFEDLLANSVATESDNTQQSTTTASTNPKTNNQLTRYRSITELPEYAELSQIERIYMKFLDFTFNLVLMNRDDIEYFSDHLNEFFNSVGVSFVKRDLVCQNCKQQFEYDFTDEVLSFFPIVRAVMV